MLTVLLCNNTNIFLGYNSIFKKEKYIFVKENKQMIQRIQTLYLLLAFLVNLVLPFLFPLWTFKTGKDYFFMQNQVYVVLFGLSITLSLLSILSFKKRQNQIVVGRLNMIINLILLGLFVHRSLNVSGETPAVSEKGIGMFLPIVAIVLLVLANKAIKKDEDLVKSADRLR